MEESQGEYWYPASDVFSHTALPSYKSNRKKQPSTDQPFSLPSFSLCPKPYLPIRYPIFTTFNAGFIQPRSHPQQWFWWFKGWLGEPGVKNSSSPFSPWWAEFNARREFFPLRSHGFGLGVLAALSLQNKANNMLSEPVSFLFSLLHAQFFLFAAPVIAFPPSWLTTHKPGSA